MIILSLREGGEGNVVSSSLDKDGLCKGQYRHEVNTPFLPGYEAVVTALVGMFQRRRGERKRQKVSLFDAPLLCSPALVCVSSITSATILSAVVALNAAIPQHAVKVNITHSFGDERSIFLPVKTEKAFKPIPNFGAQGWGQLKMQSGIFKQVQF